MNEVFLAFLMTLIAGVSTGIGSIIALFAKRTNTKFLSFSLGFSAGVMVYVSMIEIFFKSLDALTVSFGNKVGYLWTIIAFFGGMVLVGTIDRLIPQRTNLHEYQSTPARKDVDVLETTRQYLEHMSSLDNVQDTLVSSGAMQSTGLRLDSRVDDSTLSKSLMRTGTLTALAIAIHNFPEGIATFISALQDTAIAIPIVIAISIHNIPEGIAVSAPIYYATGNKKKAFWYSFVSGLTEPIGALLAYLILMPFISDTVFGILFAMVAGIMVFISLDQLLPSARAYGHHHLAVYGLVAGMMVMAISLWLFV
ncbi:MAG: zinc transporter ZupT [Clostridiales bacterium]|jgi:ZIP family zinc transporter|nr:zinc transporter ZupT [Clostridiales bacterium]